MNVKGYAALESHGELIPFSFERRELRMDDVLIEILYCGVCHSDIHQVNNDWGNSGIKSIYPMVPGHEIIGRISSVGDSVKNFKTGDIVGVGCLVDSCQHCLPCEKGLEQYCKNGHVPTYNAVDPKDNMKTFGGYSDKIVVNEKFVLRVPEGLDIKAVAPLLCAGITTWSPLKHWGVKEGTSVAVIGIGGLGHMAVKLAKALKANVSVFTRSAEKTEYLKTLGIDNIIISTNQDAMRASQGQFDLIIDTIPYEHDVNPYIATLKTDGTMVIVGLLGNLEKVQSVPLLLGRKSVSGSIIGGIAETQELLDFCAKHNILPDVEMINIQDINQVYEQMLNPVLKKGEQSRFVIDMASLKRDS